MDTDKLKRKILLTKKEYMDTCSSLATHFSNEAENPHYSIHIASSSDLKELPLLAQEINILENLLQELLKEAEFRKLTDEAK